MNKKFLNHGLGIMSEEEHDELVSLKAINCHFKEGKEDAINADYPKLLIIKKDGDTNTVDMGGDMFQLTSEMNCQNDKNKLTGIKCRIEYYPRAYTEYCAKKKAQAEAKDMENMAFEQLTQ